MSAALRERNVILQTCQAVDNRSTLEQDPRLSDSVLWKQQRNFFHRQGMKAWSQEIVPHHITSSPSVADAYVRIVFGFLRDCAAVSRADGSKLGSLDRTKPIYVVELGSGPGRFGYLFLKKLLLLLSESTFNEIPFKYVMTDFAAQNLDYLQAHPWLQPFIEQGLLDFARFDVERDREFHLIHSGEVLSAETLSNPLITIANYLFDSIPQDAFVVSEGQLFETLVSVDTSRAEPDPDDPEILTRAEISCRHKLVSENYYDDPSWNRILLNYQSRLPDVPFLFPTAALRCMRSLIEISKGRMLFLSGDRGYSRDDEILLGEGAPAISVHGSFSMAVDYQIIGMYCRECGGQVLHPAHRAESLNISAFIFGRNPSNHVETRQAYTEAINGFGPDDLVTLKEAIERFYEALNLDQLLAYLRLSQWDHKRFWECLPALKKNLTDISTLQKQELHLAICQVWDSYLPIGEENDLAFQIGTLLFELEFYDEALDFLKRSIDLYGVAPGTAYNMGVCYYSLGQMQKALAYIDQALELDPQFEAANDLRALLAPATEQHAPKRRQSRR